MLERVGLKDRMDHLPNQLSGGQQQRVAIARAMVGNPSILLADEPTGALDQKTGAQIMQLFRELNDEKRTVIMITHDLKIASNARRVVHIIDGEITEGKSLTTASGGYFVRDEVGRSQRAPQCGAVTIEDAGVTQDV
jgi:putative ABC transport system ATP-binding protein